MPLFIRSNEGAESLSESESFLYLRDGELLALLADAAERGGELEAVDVRLLVAELLQRIGERHDFLADRQHAERLQHDLARRHLELAHRDASRGVGGRVRLPVAVVVRARW